MGDRICVMRDDEIMQVDEPINIYQNPANMFTAGFIGVPQMNFAWLRAGSRWRLLFCESSSRGGSIRTHRPFGRDR